VVRKSKKEPVKKGRRWLRRTIAVATVAAIGGTLKVILLPKVKQRSTGSQIWQNATEPAQYDGPRIDPTGLTRDANVRDPEASAGRTDVVGHPDRVDPKSDLLPPPHRDEEEAAGG